MSNSKFVTGVCMMAFVDAALACLNVGTQEKYYSEIQFAGFVCSTLE
jgi:hypothetical protein